MCSFQWLLSGEIQTFVQCGPCHMENAEETRHILGLQCLLHLLYQQLDLIFIQCLYQTL